MHCDGDGVTNDRPARPLEKVGARRYLEGGLRKVHALIGQLTAGRDVVREWHG